MPKFNGETDKVLKVKLTSVLLGARWASDHVSQTGSIPLEVQTHFVADGSAVKITVKDAEGKAIETLNGKIFSNWYRAGYAVTKPNKTGGMYFEAELPDHKLKGVSGKVAVLPPSRVTEPKWLGDDGKEPEELHPGERYALQAKIDAIPGKDGAVFNVTYLPKADAEPVPYRSLDAQVKDGKAQVLWSIPADFGRKPEGVPPDEKPTFQFEAVYVGIKAASKAMPFKPSLPMTVLEVEDALFNHDSAVFLPSAPMGPGAADGGPAPQDASRGTSGLGIVASLFRHVDQNPDKKLVIAAHADTSGDVAYNFTLSGKRGEAVLAVIENDKDKWASTCQGQQKIQDYQQILSHYHDLLGWECDPKGVDGVLGENTKKALKGFRTRYNTEKADRGFGGSPDLPESALSGEKLKAEYWKAFFDLYQWELAQGLGTDIGGLSAFRGKVQFVDGGKKFLPCGESFPIQQPDRGNFRSQTNRRIEFLLFDSGEEPSLTCPASRSTVHTKQECPIYGLRRYVRNFIAPLWLIRFRVVDEDDDPVEVQRPLKFEVKDREGRVAQSGTFQGGTQVLFFGDPLGSYFLYIEGTETCRLIPGTDTRQGRPLDQPGGDVSDVSKQPKIAPKTIFTGKNIFLSIGPMPGMGNRTVDSLRLNGNEVTDFWQGNDGTLFLAPEEIGGPISSVQMNGQEYVLEKAGTPRIVEEPKEIISSMIDQLEILTDAVICRVELGKSKREKAGRLRVLSEIVFRKGLDKIEDIQKMIQKTHPSKVTTESGFGESLDELSKSIAANWDKVLARIAL